MLYRATLVCSLRPLRKQNYSELEQFYFGQPNAFHFARGSLIGATVFATHFPTRKAALSIVQSGASRVLYLAQRSEATQSKQEVADLVQLFAGQACALLRLPSERNATSTSYSATTATTTPKRREIPLSGHFLVVASNLSPADIRTQYAAEFPERELTCVPDDDRKNLVQAYKKRCFDSAGRTRARSCVRGFERDSSKKPTAKSADNCELWN